MTTNAKIEVDDKFVILDYSLGHFKMLTEKQNKMLKAVKHDFYNPTNKNDFVKALSNVSTKSDYSWFFCTKCYQTSYWPLHIDDITTIENYVSN